jgi:peptide/nickel transport system permease protein
MMRYILRRIFWGILTICVIISVNFVIVKMVPGDPVVALIGEYPAPPDYVEQVRREYGLDQPMGVQFISYAGNMLRGDFGYSFVNRRAVLPLILERAQYTLLLIGPAIAIAFVLGVGLAMLTATRRGGPLESLISGLVMFGYSMPAFWLGQVLVLFLAVSMGLLPAAGIRSVRVEPTGWAGFWDVVAHMLMPLACIVSFKLATILRVARSSIVGVVNDDFVTTARAKGARSRRVLWRHVLPNAIVPIIIVLGYNLGHALTSSILVETVFAWPGIGTLFVRAIASRDYPVLQGILVFSTVLVVMGNLFADVLVALADPRIRRNLGTRNA